MTLGNLKPGRLNSTKLFAFTLIALGIMAVGYQNLPDPPRDDLKMAAVAIETPASMPTALIVGAIAFAGGIVVLVIDHMEPLV